MGNTRGRGTDPVSPALPPSHRGRGSPSPEPGGVPEAFSLARPARTSQGGSGPAFPWQTHKRKEKTHNSILAFVPRHCPDSSGCFPTSGTESLFRLQQLLPFLGWLRPVEGGQRLRVCSGAPAAPAFPLQAVTSAPMGSGLVSCALHHPPPGCSQPGIHRGKTKGLSGEGQHGPA